MEEVKNEKLIKICSKCGEEKLLSEFGTNKNANDGLNCQCKACINKRSKEYHEKNKQIERHFEKNQVKICPRCNIEKPINDFYFDKRTYDGLSAWCKSCVSEQGKEYRQKNAEKAKLYAAQWQKNNPEKCYIRNKKWKDKNPDKIKEENKRHYDKYREQILEKNIQYRLEHLEEERAKDREWYYANKEKASYQSLKYHLNHHLELLIKSCIKRAKKNELKCDTKEELYKYLEPIYYNGVCECCGKKLEITLGTGGVNDNSYSIDRIDSNLSYTTDNVAILCWRCNSLKKNGTWQEHQQIADWMKEKQEFQSPEKQVVNI